MPVLSKKKKKKKRDHQKFVNGFALSGLLGSGRASMLTLGTLSLGLWVIAVDPAFIAGHQSIKNCGIWIDQLYHPPSVMTTSFFLIVSEHPWDKLRPNLPHFQSLANNCVYSSHTDIKRCIFCLYKHRWCPWCNGYRRRKWTRRHEFKSCTRLIAFHIALIPFGKVWIQLFSLQLWVNSRTD